MYRTTCLQYIQTVSTGESTVVSTRFYSILSQRLLPPCVVQRGCSLFAVNYILPDNNTKCSMLSQPVATQHYLTFSKLQSDDKSSQLTHKPFRQWGSLCKMLHF